MSVDPDADPACQASGCAFRIYHVASGHHDARSDEEARACDLRRARTAEAADEDDAGRQIGEQLGAEMRGSRKAGWNSWSRLRALSPSECGPYTIGSGGPLADWPKRKSG
jgi:hypothetical protein